ncbi:MAG TPA: hypothetical protein VJU82_07620 [Acidobacteriaceae bacterium]|nr:hypothetical protein [Acidobacteriaceae bacterium]
MGSLLLLATAPSSLAQYTPLLSGGAGFFTNTNAGNTSYIPTISPVLEMPLTDRVLIEAKADLLESIFPRPRTGYDTQHFAGLSYLQADLQAAPQLTFTAGYFYTPFNTFQERLSPIWISNFVSGPIVSSIGVGAGSSLGGMLRGNAFKNDKVSISYAGYISALSSTEQFKSVRAGGGRISLYSPATGVEIGASFNSGLGKNGSRNSGMYLWWTPSDSRVRFRSEYAHAAHAQGYWFETGYEVTDRSKPETVLTRLEPLFRFQQTFRSAPDANDGLPFANTRQADFGLDYTLPHEFRLKTSYSRQFSSAGNKNLWQTGIVYRFLFPAWRSTR